ncbi:MAG: amidase, partial [Candidatus Binataceae bacterium]
NEYFFERVDPEIVRAVEKAGEALESLGGRSLKISLPHLNASTASSTVIALAEAADYHESQGWFPARAGEYSEDLKLRLQQGSELRAVDYLAASRQRTAVVRDFDAAFERVDILIAPTTPVAAPPFGTREVCVSGQTEGVRAALLRLNRPANYTGHPAISVPCGFTREGLPIGLQLIGPRYGEAKLLAIAHAYEAATLWHARRPALDGV